MYLFTSIYLFFFGDERIEVVKKEGLRFITCIQNVSYRCYCDEFKYNLKFGKITLHNKSVSLYKVKMTVVGKEAEWTEGYYPMLGPKYLKETGYPHHLAIRCHWQIHYENKHK